MDVKARTCFVDRGRQRRSVIVTGRQTRDPVRVLPVSPVLRRTFHRVTRRGGPDCHYD
jgi:hypothetical protein